MIQFLLVNYATWVVGSGIFGYGIAWGLLNFFSNRRGHRKWGKLKSGLVLVLGLSLGAICGYFYANSDLTADRRSIIDQIYDLRAKVIEAENETRDSWIENGFGRNLPSTVPWPLMIEQHEWRVWTTNSTKLQAQIVERFSPADSKHCQEIHRNFLGPKPATFEIRDGGGLKVYASWNRTDLKLLYLAIDNCIEAVSD